MTKRQAKHQRMLKQFYAAGDFVFMLYGSLPGRTHVRHIGNCWSAEDSASLMNEYRSLGFGLNRVDQIEIELVPGDPLNGRLLRFRYAKKGGRWVMVLREEDVAALASHKSTLTKGA